MFENSKILDKFMKEIQLYDKIEVCIKDLKQAQQLSKEERIK